MPSAASQTTEKQDPRVGKKFIVTVDGAPLRTPKKIVWKAYRGEVFTVTLVNGEWLWIGDKKGWLWEKECLQFDKAIQELNQKIGTAPTAENYDLRGIAYTAHGQHERAIADFNQSLNRKPQNPGVLNNRGRALYLAKKYPEATLDFDAAIRANPKHFVAMLNRALCHMARNDLNVALRDLNAAIRLNKEFPEALNNRGVVYSRKGDLTKAISDFSAALRVDPNYIDAYGNRASAYRSQKKYTEAITDLQLASQKDPLNYKPINDLAWFYATVPEASQRQPEKSVKLALEACQMTQYEDWNTLDTLSAAYASAGDFKLAQEWIATAIEHSPKSQKARLKEHQSLLMAEKLIVK